MSITEQFKKILDDENQNAIDYFLSLTSAEQSSLKPLMVKLAESDRAGYLWDKPDFYKHTGKFSTPDQLQICACYVFNYDAFYENFGSLPSAYFQSKYYQNFSPKWLQRYLNDFTQSVRYPDWLELIELGFTIDENDLLHQLVHSTSYWDRTKKEDIIDISHLDTYPVAFDVHFWWLFTHTSEIHISDRSYHDRNWGAIIATYIDKGRIDRERLLRECLLTTTRNFNKVATGWFYTLFESLKPTETELDTLLPELLQVLNGTHSKPINEVLKHFKARCLKPDFPIDEFVSTASILLTSDVKAVVNNTFSIFDQLAKQNKSRLVELCELATNALIHNDEKLQTRTAKFLLKYGDINDALLVEQIAPYYPELFSGVKTLLEPFSPDADMQSLESLELTHVTRLREDNRIAVPNDFDDQVFFVTQAFENNEPWHFDVYLQVIIEIIPQINADNIERLAPAMKGAVRALNSWNNRIGSIENLMAVQFFNVAESLTKHYPCKAIDKQIAEMRETPMYSNEKEFGKCYTLALEKMPIHKTMQERIFTQLLCHSKTLAKQKTRLPMLSTPTHAPCFVALSALCKRLRAYQIQNVPVDTTDFQIALARLVWQDDSLNAHTILKASELDGEYADILQYLISDAPLDVSRCLTLELWSIAVYRKRVDLPKFIEYFGAQKALAHLTSPFEWWIEAKTKKYDGKNHRHVRLHSRLTDKGNPVDVDALELIFHQDLWRTSSLSFVDYDKLLGLTPFDPSLVIFKHCLSQVAYGGSYTIDVDAIYTIDRAYPILMETWDKNYPELCYLFLACTMLMGKSACTQIAGELWLKTVTEQNIDNARLGTVLGKLEYDEFATLKRFTDLVNAHLMNISQQHNDALITVISHMIVEMHDTPKGTKKLLELYLELLTVTGQKAPDTVRVKLDIWSGTKSLKPIIKKITEK